MEKLSSHSHENHFENTGSDVLMQLIQLSSYRAQFIPKQFHPAIYGNLKVPPLTFSLHKEKNYVFENHIQKSICLFVQVTNHNCIFHYVNLKSLFTHTKILRHVCHRVNLLMTESGFFFGLLFFHEGESNTFLPPKRRCPSTGLYDVTPLNMVHHEILYLIKYWSKITLQYLPHLYIGILKKVL